MNGAFARAAGRSGKDATAHAVGVATVRLVQHRAPTHAGVRN
jgi:hypothetical protein